MNKISAYLRRHMNIPMCSYPVLEYARSGFRSQRRTCPQTKVSVRVEKSLPPYTGATTNFQSSERVLRQSPPKSA